jgi:glycosyl-4,4'-diaponeurosporenoate acyltransferase
VARQLLLVVIDIVVVVGISIGVGAWAPRWSGSWLTHDVFPLTRMPWEKPAFFRRLGIPRLARRLPEMGDTFGGTSKASLPGTSPMELADYLVEVRRAEWVHWVSIVSAFVLFAFNPWWLALAFVIVVALGNLPFVLVLRNNRFRIQRILEGGRR